MIETHKFYKDSEGWFIDLPEFIEQGLGSKGNLAMVLGADTFLDKLALVYGQNEVFLTISDEPFEGSSGMFDFIEMDQPIAELEEVGHPIQYGANYMETKLNHQIWLCPVTIYVFGGAYPKNIYYKLEELKVNLVQQELTYNVQTDTGKGYTVTMLETINADEQYVDIVALNDNNQEVEDEQVIENLFTLIENQRD